MQLNIHPQIVSALKNNEPVVALESTIISHGMPYPANLQVANEIEAEVLTGGAVPATIAILNGQVHIGLSAEELNEFGQSKDVRKCSRRDLPFVISQRQNGATTVAATMIFAEMAGIRLFATGGIGGVHRGAENTMDVSADLFEFAQTSVAVVSAGAKAILDLPKTMEYLETLGVPVVGLRTDHFPAFYSRSSEMKVPIRLNTEEEIAAFMKAKWDLGLKGGVLIANPIPMEHEILNHEIEPYIQSAIEEAEENGIVGKDLTPFLLRKLHDLTQGRSQAANRALVLHNARIAAHIARAFAAF
jgi:pseudouridine-5'-phosphate glycosidase